MLIYHCRIKVMQEKLKKIHSTLKGKEVDPTTLGSDYTRYNPHQPFLNQLPNVGVYNGVDSNNFLSQTNELMTLKSVYDLTQAYVVSVKDYNLTQWFQKLIHFIIRPKKYVIGNNGSAGIYTDTGEFIAGTKPTIEFHPYQGIQILFEGNHILEIDHQKRVSFMNGNSKLVIFTITKSSYPLVGEYDHLRMFADLTDYHGNLSTFLKTLVSLLNNGVIPLIDPALTAYDNNELPNFAILQLKYSHEYKIFQEYLQLKEEFALSEKYYNEQQNADIPPWKVNDYEFPWDNSEVVEIESLLYAESDLTDSEQD